MWVTVFLTEDGDVGTVVGFDYDGQYVSSDPEKAAKALAYEFLVEGGMAVAREVEVP